MQLIGQQIESFYVKRESVTFHLIEGRAWITYDDNDVIVESGETVQLPASKHPIIVSSANLKHAINYQIA